jgi:GNAT superfamily N-acetyltransferase
MIDPNYLSDHEFQSIFANCRQYWLNYGLEAHRDDDIALYRTGIAHPQLNGVVRLRGNDMDSHVTEARLQLSDVPSLWWIGADSDPEAVNTLIRHGGAVRGKVPVFAIRIIDLPPVKTPDGVVLEEIIDPTAIREWVECFCPPMGISPDQVERMHRTEQSRADEPGSYRRFSARIDGRIVATSALLDAADVAGIYVCTTSEAHRRKGIATALTAHAARAGAEQGCELATLQASPHGALVYSKLGFWQVANYNLVVF